MSGVFISYRRDDSQGWAARLADDLAKALGPDLVFSDIEIPIGSDFGAVLHRAIAACDVLLVVIGRRWAVAETPGGQARLFHPDDWVRTEIEAALSLGKPVIPVPVAGAALPTGAALPASLRPMLRLQAAPLSERHWHADVGALAERLRALVPGAQAPAANRGESPVGAARSASASAPGGRDTLAEILREIAEQLRRDARDGPAPARAPSVGAGLGRSLLRALGRRLGRLLGIAMLAAAAYAGLRLLGDATLQRQLDRAEQRVQAAAVEAWRRLNAD